MQKSLKKIEQKAVEVVSDSSFLITINSNQVDIPKKSLEDAFDEFYEHVEKYLTYRYDDPVVGIKKIRSIDCEYAVESGPTNHRLHIHALITIKHTTNLHFNENLMREFFAQSLEVDAIHLDIKYIRDPTLGLKYYIRKNPV